MTQFDQITELSKKLSKAILKGKKSVHLKNSDFLDDKDKKNIVNRLNRRSYWLERNKFLDQINTNKEWKNLEKKISNIKTKRLTYIKYAAAAVVIIGVSLSFILGNGANNSYSSSTVILGGSGKAILTLENGKQVTLAKKRSYSNANAKLIKNKLLYNNSQSVKVQPHSYNVLTIPRGGEFFVKLSDGTKVWLNSETKLKYPVRFSKNEPRIVELLYGEAFFDVTHSSENGGSAFQVLTKNQQITVMGTEFNIQAYKNENIFTTLVKGKVTVNIDENLVVLEPGLQSIVSRDTLSEDIHIREVEINEVISWKKGFFSFNKMKLEEMMTILSRWYDLDIIYENEQKKNLIFSGELKRSHSINNLLLYLEKTGDIKFKIDGKKLYIK